MGQRYGFCVRLGVQAYLANQRNLMGKGGKRKKKDNTKDRVIRKEGNRRKKKGIEG